MRARVGASMGCRAGQGKITCVKEGKGTRRRNCKTERILTYEFLKLVPGF
jgi:hypothetical protein